MTLRSDRKYRRDVSLYEPIGTDKEGNEICLVDVVEVPEQNVVEKIYFSDTASYLGRMMPKILTEREYWILQNRYGLWGIKPMTQKEAALQLGISRSYVSRIEKRALLKCRNCLEANTFQ
ncbi:MAG: sigma factor-like helix-turn-helix DNA-binding protein [Clostridiales bacterium]|nr:sigma factor-like helix-turn-helix DNA-binding protein [Clostridiales bacterium]